MPKSCQRYGLLFYGDTEEPIFYSDGVGFSLKEARNRAHMIHYLTACKVEIREIVHSISPGAMVALVGGSSEEKETAESSGIDVFS